MAGRATMDTANKSSPQKKRSGSKERAQTNNGGALEIGGIKANLAKAEIVFGDVASVLRELLSLGEVGVCVRLLDFLEGLQPLDRKGAHSPSNFRQLLQSFVSKDRRDHPQPGICLLERLATNSSIDESPRSCVRRRKKRTQTWPKSEFATNDGKKDVLPCNAAHDHEANLTGCAEGSTRPGIVPGSSKSRNEADIRTEEAPTIQDLIEAYMEASAGELIIDSPRNNTDPSSQKRKHAKDFHLCAVPQNTCAVEESSRVTPPRGTPPFRPSFTKRGAFGPSLDFVSSDLALKQSNGWVDFRGEAGQAESPPSPKPTVSKRKRKHKVSRAAGEDRTSFNSEPGETKPRRSHDSEASSAEKNFPRTTFPGGTTSDPLRKSLERKSSTNSEQVMKTRGSSPNPSSITDNRPSFGHRHPEQWTAEPVESHSDKDQLVYHRHEPPYTPKDQSSECQVARDVSHAPSSKNHSSSPPPYSQQSDYDSECMSDDSLDRDSDSDSGASLADVHFASQASLCSRRSSQEFSELEFSDAQWFATSSHRFMIHPHSRKRFFWDVAALLIMLTESATIPLVVSFDVSEPAGWFWFSTAFFAVDIALNCHTGYFQDGLLVMQRSVVVPFYLRHFFIIDLCSVMPWELVLFSSGLVCGNGSCETSGTVKLLQLARLLRLIKSRSLFIRIEDMFPSNVVLGAISLLKFVTLIALFCHWSACIWAYIGNPIMVHHESAGLPPHEYGECEPGGPCEAGLDGSPWLRRYGYESFDFGTQYLAALHFAVGLVTAQEADIRPGYWVERIYSILLMIISLSVSSLIISKSVVILDKMNQGRAEFQERMQRIKEFMQGRKVPVSLQAKVTRYLEYQFHSMRNANAHVNFVEELSPWIRLELTEHLNKDIITRHPFFFELPSSIVKHFCARARTVLYAPGDVVVQRGYRATSMGFIVKGKLRVVSKGNKSILTSPSWIGDTSLFVDLVRKWTIISMTHSELLTITKDVVTEFLNEFPKLQAPFDKFKQHVEEGDYVSSGAQCQHCLLFGHDSANCPRLAKGLAGHLRLPNTVSASVGAPQSMMLRQRSAVDSSEAPKSRVSMKNLIDKVHKFRRSATQSSWHSTPTNARMGRRRSSGVAPIKFAADKSRTGSPCSVASKATSRPRRRSLGNASIDGDAEVAESRGATKELSAASGTPSRSSTVHRVPLDEFHHEHHTCNSDSVVMVDVQNSKAMGS